MIREEKDALRREMRAVRDKISIIEMAELSARVCEKILAMPEYQAAKTVMCYAGVNGEVSTAGLLRQIVAGGKRLVMPVVRNKRVMEAVLCPCPDKDLKPGAFGILEPTGDQVVPPSEIDLVLTPGLAFDPEGNRLGHGAGYYDRFLRDCPAVAVGMAFDVQMARRVPADENDIKMRRVVTETTVFDCRKLGG